MTQEPENKLRGEKFTPQEVDSLIKHARQAERQDIRGKVEGMKREMWLPREPKPIDRTIFAENRGFNKALDDILNFLKD